MHNILFSVKWLFMPEAASLTKLYFTYPLESILPKGNVTIDTSNDELCMTAITAINTEYVYQDAPIKSFACIPVNSGSPSALT